MASVLVLFSTGDEPESKKLRDLIQSRLGTSYNLKTIKDVLVEDSKLDDELSTSSCVILVVSKQSSDLLRQKNAQKDCGGIVMFDGALIQQHIEEKNLLGKMIIVKFTNGLEERIPAGFDNSKVFTLEGNLEGDDKAAILDKIADTVKGTVSSKANEKSGKKEKQKKKCTQM